LDCSTPEEDLPAALAWERLLLDKAAAAGSTAVLVYNTKLTSSTPAADAAEAAVAAVTVPRLQTVLNPGGALASQQLELSREEASDPLAAFLQAAAAEAKQHEAVPCSLPEEYLSGGCWVGVNGGGGRRGGALLLGGGLPVLLVACCRLLVTHPPLITHLPIPPGLCGAEDALVFLNIPMDAETPSMRLLRPQVRRRRLLP
jgi:hypothetical protein